MTVPPRRRQPRSPSPARSRPMTVDNGPSRGRRSWPVPPPAARIWPHARHEPCARAFYVDEPLVAEAGVGQAVWLLHPPKHGPRALTDVFCKLPNGHKTGEKIAHWRLPQSLPRSGEEPGGRQDPIGPLKPPIIPAPAWEVGSSAAPEINRGLADLFVPAGRPFDRSRLSGERCRRLSSAPEIRERCCRLRECRRSESDPH